MNSVENRWHAPAPAVGSLFRIQLRTLDQLEGHRLEDIHGDIFVWAKKTYPLGTRIFLAVILPHGGEVMLRGRVMDISRGPSLSDPVEMGIELIDQPQRPLKSAARTRMARG